MLEYPVIKLYQLYSMHRLPKRQIKFSLEF